VAGGGEILEARFRPLPIDSALSGRIPDSRLKKISGLDLGYTPDVKSTASSACSCSGMSRSGPHH